MKTINANATKLQGKKETVKGSNVSNAIEKSGTVEQSNFDIQVISKRDEYKKALQAKKEAKDALTLATIERLGVKTVTKSDGTVKEVKPSKTFVSKLVTIETLKAENELNSNDSKRLLKAMNSLENLSPSKLYKRIVAIFEGKGSDNQENAKLMQQLAFNLLGSEIAPDFNTFKTALGDKFTFSDSDAINVLEKLNPKTQLAKKVERQNKATDAK